MTNPNAVWQELLEVAQRVAGDPLRFGVYDRDPLGFCRDVLGVKLWKKQEDLILAPLSHRRVAVRSGHGVGKSFAVACLSLWWWIARRGLVITTAPTKSHLEDVLWREIHMRLQESRVPIPGERNLRDLSIDPTWYMSGVTTDQEGAFQGRHHPRLLVVVDEAAGVAEQTMLEIDTCASAEGNAVVLIGNPTSTSGTFYNAFGKNRASWHTFKISCLDHPNVKAKKELIAGAVEWRWVEGKRKSWGETHPFWYSRVLGDFPAMSTRGVVPLMWAERACNDERRQKALDAALLSRERKIAGLDVARYGDNLCVFMTRRGDAVESIQSWGHTTLTETAGRTLKLCADLSVDTLVVDAAGLGAGVYDILADAGLRVLGYNGGHPALNRGAFSNRRCELWWHLRQRFEKERLWLPEKVPETEKLLADLVAPEYELTMAGRIKVETKEKLLERGVPSPDFADSLTLCFASDPNPEEALQEEPEFGRDPILQEELLPPGGEEEGFEEFSEPIGQFPVGY